MHSRDDETNSSIHYWRPGSLIIHHPYRPFVFDRESEPRMRLSHSTCMASLLPLLVIVVYSRLAFVREICPPIPHPLAAAVSNFSTVTCMTSATVEMDSPGTSSLSLSLSLSLPVQTHTRTHTSCESVGFPRLFFILVSSLLRSLRNLSASFVH
jgi:hypothetical protein